MEQKTFQQLIKDKLPYDETGVTNPHAFKWQEKDGMYFPVNFRLLSLSVYKFPLGECTNGGVSANSHTVYIPCDDGPVKAIGSHIDQNLILFPEQRGENYWALKPANCNRPDFNGPMAGGNLAYTSDSRCKVVYHIHDRFERWYNS